MTNQDRQSAPFPRWESAVHPRRRGSLTAAHRGERGDGRYLAAYRRLLTRHRRLIRRTGIGVGLVVGLFLFGCLGLWWRLTSGPITLDAFTPWLVSAIEDNFGSRERTEIGGAAVRVRDIVVRDPDGTIVASAPKAEIHVSGLSLLRGHMRAESLNLVGAELAVRIEPDGNVTVFASGADKHPIATATAPGSLIGRPEINQAKSAQDRPAAGVVAPAVSSAAALPRPPSDSIAALLTWLDSIRESGLDGH